MQYLLEFREALKGRKKIENLLREKLKMAALAHEENFKSWTASPIYKWALAQPGFIKARKFLSRSQREQAALSGEYYETVINSYLKIEDDATVDKDIFLERVFSSSIRATWSSHLFHALYEYHHTDTAQRIYEVFKDAEKVFSNYEKGLNEVVRLVDKAGHETRYGDVDIAGRFSTHRVHEAIKKLPIQRDSQHKSEQLFVYRMWRLNLRKFNKPKPELIAELLTMDGFAHQFDIRTIERMCARFQEAKKVTQG